MQTTILIFSGLGLVASAATLVVVVVFAKKAEQAVNEIKVAADSKIDGLKRAVAEL